VVGLFDYDNDNVPGISATTSVLIAPGDIVGAGVKPACV